MTIEEKSKCVLFDLDGTLTDSCEGVVGGTVYGLEKAGLEIPSRDVLMTFIGPPLTLSFRGTLGLDEQTSERVLTYYREYYNERGYAENRVYDGVELMLAALKAQGYRLFVATSKPEEISKRIVATFGLDKYFERVFGASLDDSRSSKASVLAYALEAMGADGTNSVMVGDRKFDVIGAAENGLKCIGVLYGYGDRKELEEAGAAAIAETPDSVVDIIKDFMNGAA